jgi:predicted Zn-dependent protease
MSTITVSSAYAPTARAPRSRRVTGAPARLTRRVRLTRRGRALFFGVFLAVALAAMTALGSWAAASREAGTPEPVRIVEVHPGDTLYDIAGEVAAPGKIREMVAHIEQLNALDGPELQVGEKIAVPRG